MVGQPRSWSHKLPLWCSGAASQQLAFCLQKAATKRTAAASARIQLTPAAFEAVQTNSLKKGDVLTVAQIAGAEVDTPGQRCMGSCHQPEVQGCIVIAGELCHAQQTLLAALLPESGPEQGDSALQTSQCSASQIHYPSCEIIQTACPCLVHNCPQCSVPYIWAASGKHIRQACRCSLCTCRCPCSWAPSGKLLSVP